ncbi:MAG: mechanosensitive ion channel family protein [archaeon]|nr:MAG: mechanosensitive ion channel family protein [archaeon]
MALNLMVLDLAEITGMQFFNYTFWNNTMGNYTFAFIIFLVVLAVLRIFKYVIIKRLKKLVKKTKTDIDDLVVEAIENVFKPPFYSFVSFYVAIRWIVVPEEVHLYLYYILVFVGTYYGFKFVSTFIDYGTKKIIEKQEKEEGKKKLDTSAIKMMSSLIKGILVILAFLLILSNLGYNINSLIAGLGIGGIAIAFALQNILSDIFASFSLHFDSPLSTGDFIVIGEDAGTVKKIGIQSTRITTLQGEELVVSNRELVSTRVHNYKKMRRRRTKFEFGVIYGTPSRKLEKIPKMVADIINGIKLAETDRVHFREFGDSSLKFEVVYYINSKDYKTYMDIQQEINFEIKKKFEKEKIEMAFPTRTIFLEK